MNEKIHWEKNWSLDSRHGKCCYRRFCDGEKYW